MEFIQSLPLSTIVFCFAGLALIVSAFYFTSARREFEQNGIEVEGVVFTSELKSQDSFDNSSFATREVIIRFVTKEQLWITAKPRSDFNLTWFGQYEEGKAVKVIYNPNDPNDFVIKSKHSKLFLQVGLIALGFISIGAGIVIYMN